MSELKKVIIGAYNNGFKAITRFVRGFDLETLRSLEFYYDDSVIYFMLMEENKIKKTVFKNFMLPPEVYYNLINEENSNPLSMEPIRFELNNLPKFLNATNISTFDKEYNYNHEIKTTSNYEETEKAFLDYAKAMLPQLTGMDFESSKDIISANPFDFIVFNKTTNNEILNFLLAFEYKNPTLEAFISNYRCYILYKTLIDGLNNEETPSSRRA